MAVADPVIETLYKAIEEKATMVKQAFDKEDAERAKDPNYVMPESERKAVKDANKAIEDLEHQVKDREETAGIRARNSGRLQDLSKVQRYQQPGEGKAGSDRETKADHRSVGQAFVESDEFKGWLQSIAPNGHIPDSAKGLVSPPFQVKALITGASATQAGALINPDVKPLVEFPFKPITILDLITNGTTGSDTVEYPRITGYTNAGAPVAEATATGVGGTKPESGMTLTRITTPVRTIAHWVPATKRALSDAGQIRTIIDAFLRQGLREVVANQVLNGNGTGENFTGILNTAGLTAQAYDATGEPLLTTTRKARTKVRTIGRAQPTGYVLNPADWETIDLLRDAENRYFFGGPSVLGTPRLWGLPVAEEEEMPAGRGLVGDLRQAVLWDREQATIQVSDSHSDFFIRNLVAILAEMRAAFGVLRPAALVDIDLTAA